MGLMLLIGLVSCCRILAGHTFLAIFFCYPTICIVSFATFICKQITPTVSVLDSDDKVHCSDPDHRALQVASGFVIAVRVVV